MLVVRRTDIARPSDKNLTQPQNDLKAFGVAYFTKHAKWGKVCDEMQMFFI